MRLTVQSDSESPAESSFIVPRYDGESISNLPDTFARLLNVEARRPLGIQSFYDFLGEDEIENVVFLLLDGFGANSIAYAKEKFGFPSFKWFERNSLITPLTSVFPSTTSTATTTLHTGLTPQEHGVIGYTSYLNEIGAVAQMLQMDPVFGRRSIFDLGVSPETFVGAKTIHERLVDADIVSKLYISKYIVGSGLSQVTNRGADVIPILSSSDLFVKLRKNLEEERAGPSFHFAYYASPDTIAHSRGPFSEEYAAEIENVFHGLYLELVQKSERRTTGKKKTALLISADHGLAQIAKQDIVDLAHHRDLLAQLKVPPTGDSRSLFLHAKSDKAITVITNYFETRFPNEFHVIGSRDALRQGLLGRGEIKGEVVDRIGDVVIVPKGSKAVDNSVLQPRSEYVPGRHGGLSADEMLVPLIACRV